MRKIKDIWNNQNLIIKIFLILSSLLAITSILSLNGAKVFQIIPFYIFGIWTLMFMGVALYLVIKKIELKMDNKFIIYSIIVLVLCSLMYLFIFTRTRQIYTWDQRCYYELQIELSKKFNKKFWGGIKNIVVTTYKEDYGDFLLSFTFMIFNFTDKTENSFILTYAFCEILPVIFVLLLNGKNIIDKFNLKNENRIMVSAGLILLCFPLLHKAAITGQPDIFGLFFVGLIVLLTTGYDFSKRDIVRWIYIIICTFLLAITRRWYIFWLIGYYISYIMVLILNVLIKKDTNLLKNIIINGMKFALLTCFSLIVLLFPIIKKTLTANYQVNYSAWDLGGINIEIYRQFQHIGIIAIIICVFGVIYGLYNRRLRSLTICWMSTYVITLFLFNRIQTMGYHQSLILVPEYLMMMYLACIAISQIKNTVFYYFSQVIFVIYLLMSFVVSITNNKYFYEKNVFSNISTKPVWRQDYENIGEVVSFLVDNCNSNKEKIYANFASGAYCGDVFKEYLMPNEVLKYNTYYESSIDSVHGFPIGILKAKYVLIANKIIDSTGATKSTIIPTINKIFSENNIVRNKFELVKEFEIIDDLKFYCYERKIPFDIEEGNYWKDKFKSQTELYPKLFGERIDKHMNNN